MLRLIRVVFNVAFNGKRVARRMRIGESEVLAKQTGLSNIIHRRLDILFEVSEVVDSLTYSLSILCSDPRTSSTKGFA